MPARGLVSALLVAAFALMPLSAFAQIARQADPGTFTTVELVDSGHRFFGTVSRGLALTIQRRSSAGASPTATFSARRRRRLHRRPALRRGHALYPECRRAAGLLAGALVGFDFGAEGARTMMLVYNLPRPRRSTNASSASTARPISSAASA